MSGNNLLWPNDLIPSSGDRLIGWRLANGWVCVAAKARNVIEGERKGIYGQEGVEEIGELGEIACDSGFTLGLGISTIMCRTIDSSPVPTPTSFRLITFTPPNVQRLRYLTLEPISFELALDDSPGEAAGAAILDLQDQFGHQDDTEDASIDQAIAETLSQENDPLEEVLSRINEVYTVRRRLNRGRDYQNERLEPVKVGRTSDHGGLGFSFWQVLVGAIIWICDVSIWHPLPVHLGFPSGRAAGSSSPSHRLSGLSVTFRQLSLRAHQARDLPSQLSKLRAARPRIKSTSRATKNDGGPGSTLETDLRTYSIQYIGFYNTVWLIVNDVIIGCTIGSMVRANAGLIEHVIRTGCEQYLRTGLQDSLIFLNEWPVGLKLNTPLSALFSQSLGSMAETAYTILRTAMPHLPLILWAISWMSSFGATFFLSLLADGMSLVTSHLRLGVMVMSVVYKWNMSGLYSLWNLFRGKRWNVMRLRVDRFDYDNDQLFLGTLLFTILLFLTPTVWAYYALFASLRLAVLYMHLALETVLAFLNAFPLFGLLLRLKEPSRLPGGIAFVVRDCQDHRFGRPHLELRGAPIGFAAVFAQFWKSWALLMRSYSPLRLLIALVIGDL